MWHTFYNKKGWAKIAPFDTKGKLGNAYVMFKHKYWKTLDNPKKMKARPVNPMCSHPMWTLFNAVGKAWMFVINQWQAEHHILKNTVKVPEFLDEAKNRIISIVTIYNINSNTYQYFCFGLAKVCH